MLPRTIFKHALRIRIRSKHNIISRFQSTRPIAERVTDGFVEDLRAIVGKSNVSTAEAVRDQHGHDESYHPSVMPDVVVFAQSVGHVSRVAQFCNTHLVPLIPFGSGTGLEGGINATRGGVCLDVSQMKNIVAVNAEDFDCTVESGVTRGELNSYIRDTGLQFPIVEKLSLLWEEGQAHVLCGEVCHGWNAIITVDTVNSSNTDPGADASLCGMCSTSASGTNAVRYGTMRENTLNLEVVLADGSVFWTSGKGKRCKKTSAGYNLTNLFVGSEGTLGIITKATICLYGIPEATLSAVVHFPSVQEAVDTTVQVLQCGVPMARIEFLDEVAIDAFNKYSHYDMKAAPSLFLEFHGSPSAVQEQVAVVEEIASANNGEDFKWATDPDERNKLWKARHEIIYACSALIPGAKPYSTDVCVPISNLPEIIIKSKEMIQNANLIGPMVGHVGDGNFHVFYPVDPKDPHQLKRIKEVSHNMCLLAMDLNGTCTGEHGIGLGKVSLLEKEIGPEGMAAMQTVKRAFDPNNILNPGKVFA